MKEYIKKLSINKKIYIFSNFFYLLFPIFIFYSLKKYHKYKIRTKEYNHNFFYFNFIERKPFYNILTYASTEEGDIKKPNKFSLIYFRINDKQKIKHLFKDKYFYIENKNRDYNYYTSYLINKNSSCPIKTKKCGIFDTINNILCLPIEEECPINHIVFNEKDKNINLFYKKINLNSNDSIYYTNQNIEHFIYSELVLSKYPICADPIKKNQNLNNNFNNYCLNRNVENIYFNKYYEIIYNNTNKNDYSLYSSPYIGINLNYIKNNESLYYFYEELNYLIDIKEKDYEIIIIFLIGIIHIIFIIILLFNAIKNKFLKNFNKYILFIKKIYILINIINLIIFHFLLQNYVFIENIDFFYNKSDELNNKIIDKSLYFFYYTQYFYCIYLLFTFINIFFIWLEIFGTYNIQHIVENRKKIFNIKNLNYFQSFFKNKIKLKKNN